MTTAATTAGESIITTTLGELAAANDALGRLSRMRLPVRAAYHVSKLCKLVGAETKHFFDQRNAWVEELGEEAPITKAQQDRGEKPQKALRVKQSPHWDEFERRVEELAAIPVSIPWGPFDLSALSGDLTIAPEDILALGPLVVLGDPVEKPTAA